MKLFRLTCVASAAAVLAVCGGSDGPDRGELLDPAAIVTTLTVAQIDAATAQPTTPSSQWLSPRSGRCFHSSTVRPRPSVFTRYSLQWCSASRRCGSGLLPKSDRHPGSPIGTARRACTNDFQ